MEVELRHRGICFETHAVLPIRYRGLCVGRSEADVIVYPPGHEASPVIMELKATTYAPRHSERAQLSTYLRDFDGVPKAKQGVLVNFRQPTSTSPAPDNVDFIVIEGVEVEWGKT
jgi:GxxExxY protein